MSIFSVNILLFFGPVVLGGGHFCDKSSAILKLFNCVPFYVWCTEPATIPPKKEELPVVKEEESIPGTPKSGESTPRRLQKQIDKAIGDHRTSASMINAVIGPNGISTRGKNNFLTLISESLILLPYLK